MVPIKVTNSHRLAKRHAESILTYLAGVRKGATLVKINNWVTGQFGPKYNLTKILMADHRHLDQIVKIYIKKPKAIPTEIDNFKNLYAYFRTTAKSPYKQANGEVYDGFTFARGIDLSVCPYCNRNYIYNLPTIKKATCELDHFYNKSTYPFLALSFYNLIPSCKTCNYFKLDGKKAYYNLHDNSLTDSEILKFSVQIMGADFMDNEKDLKLCYDVHSKYWDTFEDLQLKELYDRHIDQVQDLLKKEVLYKTEYIDQLVTDYEGKLFKNREELISLLLSGNIQPEKLSLKPFSKLTKDIWEQISALK